MTPVDSQFTSTGVPAAEPDPTDCNLAGCIVPIAGGKFQTMDPAPAITIHVPGPLRAYCAGAAQLSISAHTVRAALGLPNPEQEVLKARLTMQIYSILKDSGMTQVEIAKILGVQQPQVSLLMQNRAGNFSVGRLMEFLTALRQDVEITVRPTRKEHGVVSVVSA